MSTPRTDVPIAGTVEEYWTKGTAMSHTDDESTAAGTGDPHGAMPMPHGSDDAAPLPSEDGAMPMPHGSDDASSTSSQDGALPMPHGPADPEPPAQDAGLPMPHAAEGE